MCIWIPLFLTRHAHTRTHKHTKMHRCNHAAHIPSCADPHRHTQRTLPVGCCCSWHSVDIIVSKSRVRLMLLSTGAGRRSLSHTQALCSKTYVTVFLSLSLSLFLSLFPSLLLVVLSQTSSLSLCDNRAAQPQGQIGFIRSQRSMSTRHCQAETQTCYHILKPGGWPLEINTAPYLIGEENVLSNGL